MKVHLLVHSFCLPQWAECCKPYATVYSNITVFKPVPRRKAIKGAIVQKLLGFVSPQRRSGMPSLHNFKNKAVKEKKEKKADLFSVLVPPNLFYLPVSLKSFLFTSVFSRILRVCSTPSWTTRSYRVPPMRALPALTADAKVLLDLGVLSPLLHHSRSSLHAQPKQQSSHGEGCHVEILRHALWPSPQTQHDSDSSPAVPLVLEIFICLSSVTHGKAVLPAHYLSDFQLSRLRRGRGSSRGVEGMLLMLCASAGFWVSTSASGLGCCVCTSPLCQCNAGDDFSQEIFLLPVSLIL